MKDILLINLVILPKILHLYNNEGETCSFKYALCLLTVRVKVSGSFDKSCIISFSD